MTDEIGRQGCNFLNFRQLSDFKESHISSDKEGMSFGLRTHLLVALFAGMCTLSAYSAATEVSKSTAKCISGVLKAEISPIVSKVIALENLGYSRNVALKIVRERPDIYKEVMEIARFRQSRPLIAYRGVSGVDGFYTHLDDPRVPVDQRSIRLQENWFAIDAKHSMSYATGKVLPLGPSAQSVGIILEYEFPYFFPGLHEAPTSSTIFAIPADKMPDSMPFIRRVGFVNNTGVAKRRAALKENRVELAGAPYAQEEIHWYFPEQLLNDGKIAIPSEEMNTIANDFKVTPPSKNGSTLIPGKISIQLSRKKVEIVARFKISRTRNRHDKNRVQKNISRP